MIEYVLTASGATVSVAATIAWAVVRDTRFSASERQLDLVIHVATAWAQVRGDAEVTPEQFVVAALYDPRVAIRFAGSHAGATWLRTALSEQLGEARDGGATTPRALSERLTRAIAVGRERAGGDRLVDEAIRAISAEAGSPIAVLVEEARAVPDVLDGEPPASSLDGAPYRSRHPPLVPVVLLNDARTKMTLVVDVLRDIFAIPTVEALHLMLSAHTSGRVVIGRYENADAERLVANALTVARAHLAPLQICVGEPRGSWLRRIVDRIRARSSR